MKEVSISALIAVLYLLFIAGLFKFLDWLEPSIETVITAIVLLVFILVTGIVHWYRTIVK